MFRRVRGGPDEAVRHGPLLPVVDRPLVGGLPHVDLRLQEPGQGYRAHGGPSAQLVFQGKRTIELLMAFLNKLVIFKDLSTHKKINST